MIYISGDSVSLWNPDNLNRAGIRLHLLHRWLQRKVQPILLHVLENPPLACTCNHFRYVHGQTAISRGAYLKSLWQKGMDTSLTRNYLKCYMIQLILNQLSYLDYAHGHYKLRSACIGIVRRCRVIVVPDGAKVKFMFGSRLMTAYLAPVLLG
jgi:hypothetical protein